MAIDEEPLRSPPGPKQFLDHTGQVYRPIKYMIYIAMQALLRGEPEEILDEIRYKVPGEARAARSRCRVWVACPDNGCFPDGLRFGSRGRWSQIRLASWRWR